MTNSRRVALVTGAGRGIGQAVALALIQAGHAVVCADIDLETASATAVLCGPSAEPLRLNVADPAACDAAVDTIVEKYGRLDVVVNNAGVNRDAILHKMTDLQWSEVLTVDLYGVFYLTRSAARVMRPVGWGRIVNISSVSAFGMVGQANYSAAKAGVIGLTKTAALELAGKGITVNAVAPGFIDTDMTRELPETRRQEVIAKIPAGRAGSPADVAKVVRFLSSDDAAFIVGQVIKVTGGYPL